MAKITAVFDTVEKTLDCDIDGKAVADLWDITMSRGYSDENKFGCSMSTMREDKENKTTHMTRLYASLRGDGTVEMVPERKSSLAEQIQKYFTE